MTRGKSKSLESIIPCPDLFCPDLSMLGNQRELARAKAAKKQGAAGKKPKVGGCR